MATVSTPVRQPFGILNETKLRNLESIKNRQNALTPSSAPNLKRRAPSPEISDSENIDPNLIDSAIKRKRAAFDDDVSISKQPRLITRIVAPSTKTYAAPITTASFTPRVDILSKPSSTPLSAPAAAGRSPTRLHTRHERSQPRRRFAPPSLAAPSPSISIAAALKGTLAHKRSSRSKKSSALIGESQPKSWVFDIFEESEAQQDYRMSEWTMTQSSAALDISDDEGKAKSFDNTQKADRGKENIDPNEMFVTTPPVTRAAAAAAAAAAATAEENKDSMNTEEPRSPLSDLNAADFYGEGLDATSVVLVHDDVPQEETPAAEVHQQEPVAEVPETCLQETSLPVQAPAVDDFTFEAQHGIPSTLEPDIRVEDIPEWAQRTTLTFSAQTHLQEVEEDPAMPVPGAETGDIEIWESESAKDENEQIYDEQQSQSNCVVIGEGETISLSGACLREI